MKDNYYKVTIKGKQDIFLMAINEIKAYFKVRQMPDFKNITEKDVEIRFLPDENRPNPILLAEKEEYWGRWIWCNKCGHALSPAYAKYCCYCGERFVYIQEEKVNE